MAAFSGAASVASGKGATSLGTSGFGRSPSSNETLKVSGAVTRAPPVRISIRVPVPVINGVTAPPGLKGFRVLNGKIGVRRAEKLRNEFISGTAALDEIHDQAGTNAFICDPVDVAIVGIVFRRAVRSSGATSPPASRLGTPE